MGGFRADYGRTKCGTYKTTPPYGVETFKIIGTSLPINARMLESAAIARTRSKGESTPLENLFYQVPTNELMRCIEVEEDVPFSGWMTNSVSIDIRE